MSVVVCVTLSTELSGLESLGVCHGSDLQTGNLLIVRKLGVVMTQHTASRIQSQQPERKDVLQYNRHVFELR